MPSFCWNDTKPDLIACVKFYSIYKGTLVIRVNPKFELPTFIRFWFKVVVKFSSRIHYHYDFYELDYMLLYSPKVREEVHVVT